MELTTDERWYASNKIPACIKLCLNYPWFEIVLIVMSRSLITIIQLMFK